MRMTRLYAIVFCAVPVTLLAHETVSPSTAESVSRWDVLAVCILVLLGGLYACGTWRMGLRGATQRRGERIAVWCGGAVMLAAGGPPPGPLAAPRVAPPPLHHAPLVVVGGPLPLPGR